MNSTTKKRGGLRVLELALLIGLAIFLLAGVWSVNRQQALSDKVVRLHILANSDNEADQTLKLQVRDAVLARTAEILTAAEDRAEAESTLRAALPELEALAEEEIAARGYGYAVAAELTDTAFPTREYGEFALPAGRYLALRLVIGSGEGHNWWCVVFPPLCTAAASDVPAAAVTAGFSRDDLALVTEENPGYVLKFKSLELWDAVQRRFSEK